MQRSTIVALVAVAALRGSTASASPTRAHGEFLYTAVTFCSQRPPYCSANVGVFTYPAGKYVDGWSQEGGTGGACADSAGNVYIGYGPPSGGSQILEFAHGGNTPVAILNLPMGIGLSACAVDPLTGSLAIASGLQGLFVFEGSGVPIIFSDPGLNITSVGYDNHGDAIVCGTTQSGVGFAKLPAGGTAFDPITLDQTLGNVGSIQWDGSEMSVLDATQNGAIIYRFVLHGTHGKIIGSTPLAAMDVGGDVIDGSRVVASIGGGVCTQTCPPDAVAYFGFPAGGDPVRVVKGASVESFAISAAAHEAGTISGTKQHRNARR